MTCGHCPGATEKAVHAVGRGAGLACDLSAQEVRVDSALDHEAITSAISEAGYTTQADNGESY